MSDTQRDRGRGGRGAINRCNSASPSSFGERGRPSSSGRGGRGGMYSEMHSSQGASHGFRGQGQDGSGSQYWSEPRSADSSYIRSDYLHKFKILVVG